MYFVRKIQTHPLLFGYAVLQFTKRESEKNRTVLKLVGYKLSRVALGTRMTAPITSMRT